MHSSYNYIKTSNAVYLSLSMHAATMGVCVLHCVHHFTTQTGQNTSAAAEMTASAYFWEGERTLSFQEEVSRDIVVVTCVAAELFLYKWVKTTLRDGLPLSQRIDLIRTLTKSGGVRVP